MAAVNGVNNTKAADPKAANILNPGVLGGKKRVMVDTYTASALASGSTIAVGKSLPVGAIVTGVKLGFAALGASSTLSVGDAGSATRYLAAASSATAGTRLGPDLVTGLGYVVTGTSDTDILITTGGASITGAVAIEIEYVVE